MVLGGVQHAIQLHSGFISVAEARDVRACSISLRHFIDFIPQLTGNPSPVTEIEEEAAFLIQIKDHSTQPSTVRSILDRFGTLLAFREWHPRLGDGQASVHLLSPPPICGLTSSPVKWFYVEYYDARETQAAFQDLHDRPHVLGTQFALYTTKLLSPIHPPISSAPTPSTQTIGLSLQSVVPFPSAEAPITEEPPLSRSVRPRSASAEAGDGVKAFSLASTQLAEDLRRRITAPVDWEPEFVDRPGERRRSQSFDASQRLVENQEGFPSVGHQREESTCLRGSNGAIYGHGQFGPYDLHPCTQTFIPTGPTTYAPEYILPRPAHSHTSRRIVPSQTQLLSQRVSPQVAQNYLKYRAPPSHEPSEQQMDNNLNIARIENGQDMRTTVMIKNIPNKMTDKDLMTFIERVCARRIDFFYLRMDFKNGMHAILAATRLTGNQGVTLDMRSLISLQSTISFALPRRDSVSGGESFGFL